MTETRFDVVPIRAVRADDGFIHDSPVLTRVGVFEYRDPSRSSGVRREFRPPGEVFNADSLNSYRGRPITKGHPGLVNSKNAREHTYGTMISVGRQDGENADHVVADVVIHDTSPVDAGHRELSLGYRLDLDETPGEWNGQAYDCIQKNIRVNHLALVPKGRAGVSRLNLDAADVETTTEAAPTPPAHGTTIMPDQTLVDVRLDESGLIYKAAPEIGVAVRKMHAEIEKMRGDAAEALGAATSRQAALQAEITAATTRADEAIRARDAAQGQADALKSQMDTVRTDAAAAGRVAAIARLTLEGQAKATGCTFNADASDKDIRVVVLTKLNPGLRLDSKSDDYINAAFDIELDAHTKRSGNGGSQRQIANQDAGTGNQGGHRQDNAEPPKSSAAAARNRMLQGA